MNSQIIERICEKAETISEREDGSVLVMLHLTGREAAGAKQWLAKQQKPRAVKGQKNNGNGHKPAVRM